MSRSTALVGLCLTVLLAGCSAAYSITITGDLERPTVSFRQSRKPVDICLSSLEIHEYAGGSLTGKLVWEVQTGGECIVFDSIVYGEAPAGFATVHAPEPLKPGMVYAAFGRGSTTGMFGAAAAGGAIFTYHDGLWWQPTRAIDD